MKNTLFILSAIIAVFIYCCGDDNTQNNGNNVTDPGILLTDEFGNSLGGDTTDWCMNGAGFKFYAAYPNPTHGNIVNVRFDLPAQDTIKLYFLKANGDSIVFWNQVLNAGAYSYIINDSAGTYANSYQRLYISSKRNSPNPYCRFYGDIKFEP